MPVILPRKVKMRKRPPDHPGARRVALLKFPGASPATQRRAQLTNRNKRIRITLPPVRKNDQEQP